MWGKMLSHKQILDILRLGVSYCIRWEDKIWKKYLTHLELFKCDVMAVRVAQYTALNNTC